MTVRSFVAALAVALAATSIGSESQAPAQSPPQPQTPQPTFKTEANYVRVDVYPTKDGVPLDDLSAADFEVLEDKVPQKVDTFQHIAIRGNIPQEARREPNSVRESRAMLQDSNARLFVLFLDVYHVEVEGSHNIRKPLVDALDSVIGADDFVGVMTPEMSAGDITFARKTTTIEGFLTRYWVWGEREQLNSKDAIEDHYRQCYPGTGPMPNCPNDQGDKGIAAAMIARRREKRTLDSIEDLVRFLRGVREERKAVLAITDGWVLFRPDGTLARPIHCQVPSGPGVSVDPRTGRLGTQVPTSLGSDGGECERDRQQLATIDDERQFRDILDQANRSNTSFYPIDPRGLVVFDTALVPVDGPTLYSPAPMIDLGVDRAMLSARLTSLRTLAEATDGLAIVNNNNLGGGLKRVVDDLSSYYLLGYYSGGKLDGKFHSITVRVKRPGVQVRARRGYLAATAAEVARPTTAAPAPAAAAAAAEARAFEAVVAPLESYARDAPIRLQTAVGWKPGTPPTASVWLVGEFGTGALGEELKGGTEADVTMIAATGETVATAHVSAPAGAKTFRTLLTPTTALARGDYTIRVSVRGAAAGSIPSRDSIHVAVPSAPTSGGAVVFRRGQSTRNRDVATADLRFRRNEQIRVEIPVFDSAAPTARLLDRTGKPLTIPVTASAREDADGTRWASAQAALAPLAAGDYVIELAFGAPADGSDAPRRTLFAFRVVP
jgi:VWFA-related protein